MSYTATVEHTLEDPILILSLWKVKVDQIMSTRAVAPGKFDSYTRRMDMATFDRGG